VEPARYACSDIEKELYSVGNVSLALSLASIWNGWGEEIKTKKRR